ncbi:MAG: acyltransferase [Actinomycetota bacterium]|nr:acyltransferase [Actinomycetota bacterium]
MPRPLDKTTTYLPGLDGVRTIAVALVICAHLGLPWAQGGILGVGIFFTLSGFLITSILVSTFQQRGDLRLRRFWLRRARRLLPAAVLLLIVVLLSTAIQDQGALLTRGRDTLAALFYVANWNTIQHAYVAANTAAVDPLEHLWSLSVEEQFYLAWPLILALLLFVCRGRLRVIAALTSALAAGSFFLCWVYFSPGLQGATRSYEGTDTRAGALLIGAAAALWIRSGPRPDPAGRRRPVATDLAAIAASTVIGVLVWRTDQFTAFLYPWGFVLLSISAAVLVAAVAAPRSILAIAIGCRPMRWIGERSYGIYLWQTPVIVFSQGMTGRHSWQLSLANVLVTVALAALSWWLIEDPIRRHGFRAAFRPADNDRRPTPTRGPGIAVQLPGRAGRPVPQPEPARA